MKKQLKKEIEKRNNKTLNTKQMKEELVTLSQFETLENQVGSIQEEIQINDDNILEIVNALRAISSILSQKHDTSVLDTAIDSIIY